MSRGYDNNDVAPKPYAFVPFSRKSPPQPVPGHEQLELTTHYSGRLSYQLQTLTPVFVGDGSYALGADADFPQEKVIRPFYRVAGTPTIPGSTLKGVARSITEAISPSCLTITRISPRQLPKGVSLAHSSRSDCKPTKSCPACSIFGRMSQLGKAHFGDARLIGYEPLQLFRLMPLFAPRASKSPPSYLDEKQNFKGLKFYYHSQPAEDDRQPPVEVIPTGQKVQGQVDFENLSSAEMGLLFFALGMDGTIALKLGGGKPLGLGSMRLIAAELSLLGSQHFTSAEPEETNYTGKALSNFVGKAIEIALTSKVLLSVQALALAEILAFKPDRHAPTGAY